MSLLVDAQSPLLSRLKGGQSQRIFPHQHWDVAVSWMKHQRARCAMHERTDLQRFLRPEEVAALLQVSRKTILALIRRGELQYVSVGNRYRIAPEAVNAWLRRKGGRP